MSRLRLALLNAADDGSNTRRNFRREFAADLVEFDVTSGQLPSSFAFDGCVVTGSRCSVYWNEPWLPPLKDWLDRAIEADLPFLGVCFGHQLLADVMGGEVEDMGGYEIGYREVVQFENDPLFDGIDRRFTVFTTHSDRVRALPEGATPLAATEYGNHGFRRGDVYGVQFHPEYDLETAESVTAGKDLPADQYERVMAGITEETYAAACQAKQLFGNFERLLDRERHDPVAAD